MKRCFQVFCVAVVSAVLVGCGGDTSVKKTEDAPTSSGGAPSAKQAPSLDGGDGGGVSAPE